MSHLSRTGGGASARTIAEQYNLSRAFVANILKNLCSAGFLRSERGSKGGYSLARTADSIRLLDILRAFDDPFLLVECCEEKTQNVQTENTVVGCEIFQVCPIRSPIQQIHNRILEVLRNVSLSDLTDPDDRAMAPVVLGTSRCEQPTEQL
ncbi:MAG: RrF2 family transcriptional regulator [Gemmataceae bacterium]